MGALLHRAFRLAQALGDAGIEAPTTQSSGLQDSCAVLRNLTACPASRTETAYPDPASCTNPNLRHRSDDPLSTTEHHVAMHKLTAAGMTVEINRAGRFRQTPEHIVNEPINDRDGPIGARFHIRDQAPLHPALLIVRGFRKLILPELGNDQ